MSWGAESRKIGSEIGSCTSLPFSFQFRDPGITAKCLARIRNGGDSNFHYNAKCRESNGVTSD